MGILTLQLVGVLILAIRYHAKDGALKSDLDLVKSFGSFALVTGILGQLIGLFSAFQAIAEIGAVSPAMLAGGLKVSMITTIYGVVIFLIAYMIWFISTFSKSES